MEALADADVLLIATEWKEFGQVAPADVARFMRAPVVFDGRSVFNVAAARAAGLTITPSDASTRSRARVAGLHQNYQRIGQAWSLCSRDTFRVISDIVLASH